MDKRIYKEIAKKYGVSVSEIKKEMQAAIDAIYINPNSNALSVPRKNAVPSIEEFVSYAVKQINEDISKK